MAQIVFHYRKKNSPGAALPAAIRFCLFLSLNFAVIFLPSLFLPFGLALCLLLMIVEKESIRKFLKGIRFFLLIMIFVILSRAFSQTGEAIFCIGRICLTIEGLRSGITFSLRLILVLVIAQLFIASSSSSEIRKALSSFFSLFNRRYGAMLSLMISLVFRNIPLLFDEYKRVHLAATARGLAPRSRLLRYTYSVGIKLTNRIIRSAEETTDAVLSRGFSPNNSARQSRKH